MRKFFRRLAVSFALLVLVLLAGATVLRWRGARQLARAAESFVARVGPLETSRYSRPPVDAATNPAPPVRRAAELLGKALEQHPQVANQTALGLIRDLALRPAREWTAAQRAGWAELSSAGQQASVELRRGTARTGPSSFELDFTRAWDLDLPDFRQVIALGDLQLIQARQAAEAGDWATVVGALRDLDGLARTLRAETPLIFQLVAYAIERRQQFALQLVVESPGASPEMLDAAGGAFTGESQVADLVRTVGGEGAFVYEICQDPKLLRKAIAGSSPLHLDAVRFWIFGDRFVAELLDYYRASVDRIEQRNFADAQWPQPPAESLRPVELTGLLVQFAPMTARLAATRCLSQLARTSLGLRRQGLATGTYPALADATPCEFTGRPLQRTDLPDGSVSLELPGADELWEKSVTPQEGSPKALATKWRLPALVPVEPPR